MNIHLSSDVDEVTECDLEEERGRLTRSDNSVFTHGDLSNDIIFLKGTKNSWSKYFAKKEKKSKKKKKKKNIDYDETPCVLQRDVLSLFEQQSFYEQDNCSIPDSMLFNPYDKSAFVFGKARNNYVGKLQDTDGHISIFGGSGSGKSSTIAMPTIATWRGPIFAFDFKGELVEQAIKRKRKPKVLNMLRGQRRFHWYDPFYFLKQDDDENLVQNARELAQAIIPLPHNISDPFWVMSARDILTAIILYYFDIEVGFIEAMIEAKTTPMLQLLEKISVNVTAKACVNPDLTQNPKMLAGVSAELHNQIAVFATDTLIQDVLSPSADSASSNIKWEDLNNCDIFIRIDQSKIRQWGGIIRLMLTQLVRTLERRPEKYNPEGVKIKSTLLLLDEFPQYGKIDIIVSALATLRSKKVTIALFNQSLADLDAIYGRDIRRIILDNCPYKAILNASDAETQLYFSNLTGTRKVPTRGLSLSYGKLGQPLGYNGSVTESREAIIQPHEFASLQDIVLLHPKGFNRIEKMSYYSSQKSAALLEENLRRISYGYNSQ